MSLVIVLRYDSNKKSNRFKKDFYCCDLCQRVLCLYFPLGVLQCLVSHLGLYSISSLFLCIMLRNDLILLFFKLCSYPVFPALFLAGTLSNVYSCLLCHRLIDHRCMSLLLSFLFCSIDLYFYFHVSTILFLLLQLCSVV